MNMIRQTVMVVLVVAICVSIPRSLSGQVTQDASPLAPDIPASSSPIDGLILRSSRLERGVPLRIVRHGLSGTVVRPNELDLPHDDGSFVRVFPFDWIYAVDRNVDVMSQENFYTQIVLQPEAHVIAVNGAQLELAYGVVQWRRRQEASPPIEVTAGRVSISGRGEATIDRQGPQLTVTVNGGRLDVYESGQLVAVLGAGQERQIRVTEDSNEPLHSVLTKMRSSLDDVMERARDGDVDGELLMRLWDQTAHAAALYGAAEAVADPAVKYPDVVMRDIGEALRILGGYHFTPPSLFGM